MAQYDQAKKIVSYSIIAVEINIPHSSTRKRSKYLSVTTTEA